MKRMPVVLTCRGLLSLVSCSTSPTTPAASYSMGTGPAAVTPAPCDHPEYQQTTQQVKTNLGL